MRPDQWEPVPVRRESVPWWPVAFLVALWLAPALLDVLLAL
jgi:hypothetical protein